MARVVRCGLIQARCEWSPDKFSLSEIKERMIRKHERLIAQAAKRGVKVLGLEEIFYGPYFPAEQQTRWYDLTEPVPNGPTLERMRKLAKRHRMVMVVPVYEAEMPGVYLQHRRRHRRRRQLPGPLPQASHSPLPSRFLGKVLFHPGQHRLSGFLDPLRARRRLHLLRPPFPRGSAHSGPQRRRDRLQSLGHRRRAQRIPLGTRAARARRRQRLLRRRDQSRRHRGALEYRRILR